MSLLLFATFVQRLDVVALDNERNIVNAAMTSMLLIAFDFLFVLSSLTARLLLGLKERVVVALGLYELDLFHDDARRLSFALHLGAAVQSNPCWRRM